MAKVNNKDGKRRECHRRQNGICPLCGLPIRLSETGELAPTIDHIIPVSRGGGQALDNLRLVHKVCNNLRGNDVSDIMIWADGVRVLRYNAIGRVRR